MKKYLKYFQIIISLLLIIFLFLQIDLNVLIKNFYDLNLFYVLVGIFLFIPGIIISVIKWKIILNYFNLNIKKYYSIYWIGTFFNNFLPSSFGGDGYRFFYVNKKYKDKKKKNIGAIFYERLTGLFIIAIINIIGFIFFIKILLLNKIIFYISFGIFLLSISILIFAFFGEYFYKIIPFKKIKLKIKEGIDLLKDMPKSILMKNLLLSLLFNLIILIGYFSYLKGVGVDVSSINIFLVFYLLSLINLFGLFPISLNGIGVSESLQVLLFSNLLGIKPELILLVAIIGRIGAILMSSIGGIIYIKEKLSEN